MLIQGSRGTKTNIEKAYASFPCHERPDPLPLLSPFCDLDLHVFLQRKRLTWLLMIVSLSTGKGVSEKREGQGWIMRLQKLWPQCGVWEVEGMCVGWWCWCWWLELLNSAWIFQQCLLNTVRSSQTQPTFKTKVMLDLFGGAFILMDHNFRPFPQSLSFWLSLLYVTILG